MDVMWLCAYFCQNFVKKSGGALDFEMGGGVWREAPNLGSKERIFGKIGAKELQF